MRGYLRLGARICGEPAHDPDFGVGDFPALLDKRQADIRYLNRLRSASAAARADNRQGPMTGQGRGHPWLPETTCDHHCVLSGLGEPGHLALETLRCALRITTAALVLMALPLLAIPLPGHLRIKRLYCRAMLSALGIRITLSGGPIRNLRGMLVVSNHVSWVDVFTVGAVLPGTFVARADLIDWPAVGLAARLARIIPIDRGDLRACWLWSTRSRDGCAPGARWWPSRRGRPTAAPTTADSVRPCSSPRSMPPARSSRCG